MLIRIKSLAGCARRQPIEFLIEVKAVREPGDYARFQ